MLEYKEYKEAVFRLNEYAKAYYVDDDPKVTDEEYDKLYHEVLEFENSHEELIDPNSVTQRVGYGVLGRTCDHQY